MKISIFKKALFSLLVLSLFFVRDVEAASVAAECYGPIINQEDILELEDRIIDFMRYGFLANLDYKQKCLDINEDKKRDAQDIYVLRDKFFSNKKLKWDFNYDGIVDTADRESLFGRGDFITYYIDKDKDNSTPPEERAVFMASFDISKNGAINDELSIIEKNYTEEKGSLGKKTYEGEGIRADFFTPSTSKGTGVFADINLDGYVDFQDMELFIEHVKNRGGAVAKMDINKDGVINFEDLKSLRKAFNNQAIIYDIDRNGVFEMKDLEYWRYGDILSLDYNLDGVLDVKDFNAIKKAYFTNDLQLFDLNSSGGIEDYDVDRLRQGIKDKNSIYDLNMDNLVDDKDLKLLREKRKTFANQPIIKKEEYASPTEPVLKENNLYFINTPISIEVSSKKGEKNKKYNKVKYEILLANYYEEIGEFAKFYVPGDGKFVDPQEKIKVEIPAEKINTILSSANDDILKNLMTEFTMYVKAIDIENKESDDSVGNFQLDICKNIPGTQSYWEGSGSTATYNDDYNKVGVKNLADCKKGRVTLNKAPNAPSVTGPISGLLSTRYTFKISATDPNGNQIQYGIDWNNDSKVDNWVPVEGALYPWLASGSERELSRAWNTLGTQTFKVLAKDSLGIVSPWTTHTITITKTGGAIVNPPKTPTTPTIPTTPVKPTTPVTPTTPTNPVITPTPVTLPTPTPTTICQVFSRTRVGTEIHNEWIDVLCTTQAYKNALPQNKREVEIDTSKKCQILYRKNVNGVVEATWTDAYCEGNAYKDALPQNKRLKRAPLGGASSFGATYEAFTELELGMQHPDVVSLQKFLNDNGYTVESIEGEVGSKGNEGTYFGQKTKQALIKFQQDNNISPAQGYFGMKTRTAMGI